MKLQKKPLKAVLVMLFIITFIIGAGMIAFGNRNYLILENMDKNESFKFYLKDNNFSLGYTHSVMKTPCEEFFEIDDKQVMHLTKTIYESYGVGLPFLSNTEDEGRYELIDNKFVLSMNREFEVLNMYVSHIPKHYIKVWDRQIFMNELLPEDNSKVRLYIKKGF